MTHTASDLQHLNECEKALVEVRDIIFRHADEAFADYWLGACVGSPSEIPAALDALLTKLTKEGMENDDGCGVVAPRVSQVDAPTSVR